MNLRKRWNAFARGACTGRGHSGGNRYHNHYGEIREDLFVAAFPVSGVKVEFKAPFIKYVERRLLLEYALEYGASPQFNEE